MTTLPLIVVQLPGPNNDLPEIAWLACAAALVAAAAGWRADGASRGGALLPVALVAVGLCIGTKTTGAPLAALILVLGAWRCRDQLRAARAGARAAAAAAVAIGGVWYVRNLIDHGAPFWPLSTTPWGDPVPPSFRAFDASFLSHVHAMLHRRTDAYWKVLAGGVVMGAGAILSHLGAREDEMGRRRRPRRPRAVGGVALHGDLVEHRPRARGHPLPASRLLAAAVTLALAARGRPGLAELVSGSVLLGALVVNLFHDADLTFPTAPSMKSLILAAALGAVLVLAGEGVARTLLASVSRWIAVAAAAAVALVALLAPVNGYLAAHAEAGLDDASLVRWFNSRTVFLHGSEPVLIGPVTVAVLTGARLAHPVTLLSPGIRCPVLVREARNAWVALEVGVDALADDRHWIICLGEGAPRISRTDSPSTRPPRSPLHER